MFVRNSRIICVLSAILICVAFFAVSSSITGRINAFTFISDPPLGEVEAAAKAAEDAVKKAVEAVTAAEPIKTKIEIVSSKVKADETTLTAWEELTKYLKENTDAVLKRLNDGGTSLSAQDKKIDDLIKRLDDAKTAENKTETEDAVKKLKEAQKKVKDKNTEVGAAKDDLKTAADKVYKSADAAAKELPPQIKKLVDLPVDAEVAVIQKNLPAQLPILSGNITLQAKFAKVWQPLDTELKKFTASPAAKPAEAIAASKKTIVEVLAKFDGWLDKLGKDAEVVNQSLFNMRIEIDKDLPKNAVLGLKLLGESEDKEKALKSLSESAEIFVEQLKTDADFAPARVQTAARMDAINATLKQMPDRLGLVREGLAGDFKDFVADFVPLYYFTDVFNLMKILNPEAREIRDVSALREEAAAARRKVDQADLDLADAQAEVNGLQTEVRDFENALKQAEQNFNVSDRLLTQAKRSLEKLQNRPSQDAEKIRQATQRTEDAEKENTANKETYDKLKDEKTGLPAKILAARENLLKAQKQVREGRNKMIALAQVESEAFAAARSNESVFFAPNVVTSKDPVKQVIIYAFSSRKVVYLRGRQQDVDKAKNIIALFDRPAPQARMTLWTLELNSTADKAGAKKFNESLELIERQLSDTRSQIAAVLSFLRDCINEEVNALALGKLRELETARSSFAPVNNHQFLAPDSAEDMRWARMFFYQKEVLVRLGFDPEIKNALDSRNQSRSINQFALPDPAGTTTLGESLIILSLANAASRYEIMEKFSSGVEEKLNELGFCPICEKEECRLVSAGSNWFASTKRALGADFKPYFNYTEIDENQLRNGRNSNPTRFYPATYAFTSMQKEIVNSITKAMIPRLITRLIRLQKIITTLPSNGAAYENTANEITHILIYLWDELGIAPEELPTSSSGQRTAVNFEKITNKRLPKQFLEIAKRKSVLRTANAQVARTDLMLKQMIDAVDDDINRHFVQPMMTCLRENLVNKRGIGVGVINRTSVLATNRLVARVDPRSSAQLTVGEEQDVLQGTQQLANLFLAAKTGGLLGGLTGLQGVQQQKETSEVYGLTSGSVFKVTPIFDPTGQSLRFQFDYILANLVTDPNGSINPQLPRIERHTVNTEVQLNNLELREISRFEANSRLGIPTTYKGGVPIIKDIPGMKYVPLLGWFVRKSGKSAVIQQSLMLGQTTMYPTIADIFDLLSGDDYFFDTDEDEQDCCKTSETRSGSSTENPDKTTEIRSNQPYNSSPDLKSRPQPNKTPVAPPTPPPPATNPDLDLRVQPTRTPTPGKLKT